jgi:hypothetical protein
MKIHRHFAPDAARDARTDGRRQAASGSRVRRPARRNSGFARMSKILDIAKREQ